MSPRASFLLFFAAGCAANGPVQRAEVPTPSVNAVASATPHPKEPAPEVVRALDLAKAKGKLSRGRFVVSEAVAREILGDVRAWKKPIESASVHAEADGFAALVTLVLDCGGDSCSTETWLLRGGAPGKLHVGGGSLVVLPSLDAVIADNARFDPVDPNAERVSGASNPEWIAEIVRVEIDSGKSTVFAPCVSPVLSPARHFIVCRSRRGAVLRVPVVGGSPEVVRGPAKMVPEWVPYAYIYPPPVKFLSADKIQVADEPGGDSIISWSEP